jgi:hypothetical protein
MGHHEFECIILSFYHVHVEFCADSIILTVASKRDKCISWLEVTSCYEVLQKLENKSDNSPIYDIIRFCVKAHIPHHGNDDNVRKRSTTAKGNNVSESIMCHSYVYFKIKVVKHAEETTVQQQTTE